DAPYSSRRAPRERAASEGPRWTRAVGDQAGHPLVKQGEQAWKEHRIVLSERAPSVGTSLDGRSWNQLDGPSRRWKTSKF
ncbi:MAG TPA: hypothetical protein PKN47_23665, partial [Nitrospira sp.]|nr:hypothetical protein [Nitrospira sp.]